MHVPSMGYEGAADYLADRMEFRDFYRLGNLYTKVIPAQLAKPYEWREIKFVYIYPRFLATAPAGQDYFK